MELHFYCHTCTCKTFHNLSSVTSRLLVENSEAHFRVIDTLLVKGSYSKRGGPPPIRRNLKPAHSESVCVCVCVCVCVHASEWYFIYHPYFTFHSHTLSPLQSLLHPSHQIPAISTSPQHRPYSMSGAPPPVPGGVRLPSPLPPPPHPPRITQQTMNLFMKQKCSGGSSAPRPPESNPSPRQHLKVLNYRLMIRDGIGLAYQGELCSCRYWAERDRRVVHI